MSEANNQAIIVIKKKVMAAGHHGGAKDVISNRAESVAKRPRCPGREDRA